MKPSHRQQAVFNCWANDDSNILLDAVAGSGKTTTLVQLLERSGIKTLFLAFNKSIQTEIQEQLDEKGIINARAMTMHSLGLKAIQKSYKYRLETGKNFKMVMELEKTSSYYGYLPFKEKVSLNNSIMSLNDVSRMFLTDDLDELYIQMETMGNALPSHPEIKNLWKEFLVLRAKSYTGSTIIIDFADMVYVPIIKKLRIPTSPVHLMIDEAQDLNLAQHAMVDKLISQGSIEKWIAVGDPKQSIYGFAGAYEASFQTFLEKDNVKELPLDICYRCPQLILDEANEVYDVMEGFKDYPGIVSAKKIGDVDGIPEGALIICRNSGPIIQLFFILLGKGRKVFLKGDDILNTLRRFLAIYKKYTLTDALWQLSDESIKLFNKQEKSKSALDKYVYTNFLENLDNYRIMVKHFEDKVSSVGMMLSYLETLFTDDLSEGITLCTIHKSKGLESKIVYILNEDLIPSEYAHSIEQKKQEENLRYVARTRASEELHYLNITKEEMKTG